MRLLFAHQLRAVAVLCVIASHYLGVYWNARPEVAAAVMGVAPGAPSPAITGWIASNLFNPGPFGVAVFFLVSGFVIPFSLERLSPLRFLVARAWRIYPTYAAALGLGLLAVGAMSAWSGQAFTITPLRAVANLLLVHGYAGQRSIDTVNWTLAAEIKFYVLMAVIAPWIGRIGWLVTAGLGCTAFGLGALALSPFMHSGLFAAGARSLFDLSFLPYMLIGTLFWLHWRGVRPRAWLILAGMVLGGAHATGLAFGPLSDLAPVFLPAYAQALLLFTAAYAARHRIRPNRILDAIASISYPLYAIHALVGYCTMDWVLEAGGSAYLAIFAAIAVASGLAACLHVTVETWSTRAGRRPPHPAMSTGPTAAVPRR